MPRSARGEPGGRKERRRSEIDASQLIGEKKRTQTESAQLPVKNADDSVSDDRSAREADQRSSEPRVVRKEPNALS